MLLSEVTDFITRLSAYPVKHPTDESLIAQLIERFTHRDNENLDKDDFIYIKNIFEKRGKQIIDTDLDYTKEDKGINNIWIDWAKQLAEANAELSFFHLLFPTVINKKDPNSFGNVQEIGGEADDNNAAIDCKSLYLGPDNESIYSILNFLAHLLKRPMSTYRRNSATLFPVSLIELSRFRKGAGHPFVIKGTTYNNLWDYLSKEKFPNFHRYGTIPTTILPLFLELISSYFELKTDPSKFNHFKKNFQQWLGCLYECSVSEVNQLYGIKINFSGNNVYLLELLLDINEAQSFVLDEHFAAIALWLNNYNPSYVVEHPALDFVYHNTGSGKFFSINMFKTLVEACAADPSLDDQIAEKMGVLLSEIEFAESLQEKMIEQLGDIYALRWEKVVNTPLDYLRLQKDANESWIRLAQFLAGAKLIPKNFYKFLMPTIQNNTEEVFDCPVTDYPLNHYVLNADKSRLILLDVCLNHYQSKGTFRYWKDGQWISLCAIEIERIQYAAKQFAGRYQDLLSQNTVPTISLRTLIAIKTLIDGSLYPKGLNPYGEYDANEMQVAERAVLDFAAYYESMDSQEQEVLKQQVIILNGERKTFESLWEEAVDKKGADYTNRECLALSSYFLLQLVANYSPNLKFTARVEEKLAEKLVEIRESSTHQVFNDYDWLSKAEAARRCQLMFISLMTHSFKMRLFCGSSLEYWDCTNTVHHIAKRMFDYLNPMIQNKDFSDSRFVYVQIMESIIKPALAAKPFSVRVTSSDAFSRWLVDVKDARVLSNEFKCHEPEPLLLFLLTLETKSAFSKFNFRYIIHDLIRTCAQEKHALDKKLRANIIVIKFISSLEIQQADMILQALSDFQCPASNLEIYRAVRSYIVGQMESLKLNPRGSSTIFTADKQEGKRPAADSNELDEEYIPASIKEIIETLKSGLHKTADLSPGEIKKYTAFLRSLDAPILTPMESRARDIANDDDYLGKMDLT